MKKIVSYLLILSLLLSLGALLASCSTPCEHQWDDGTVTLAATQETDGVKTFTCKLCSETKTESVAFAGLTEAEWNVALADAVFENFVYSEVSSVTGSGITVDTDVTYKLTADNAWVKFTAAGQSQESYVPDLASVNTLRDQLVDSIEAITPYDGYVYDAATKTYKATKPIRIEALDASTEDITLTFTDGKLTKIVYVITFTEGDISFDTTSTVTLSDYGTVVLTPPAE